MQAITISELTASAADRQRLTAFYETLFVAGFSDPDERESLDNMLAYLASKEAGWYSSVGPKNNYHIVLAEQDGRTVAGAVCDYLARPNSGVIEFLLVAEEFQRRGVGRQLHDAVESILERDAREAGYDGLDGITIEMNDPFRVDLASENMDPFVRARLWGRWGYAILNFPYVQPALSDDQVPVTCLLLCLKATSPRWRHSVPGDIVRQIVQDYLVWAMRIPEPQANAEFQQMSRVLASLPEVAVTPLGQYVGDDANRSFEVVPISDPDSSEFGQVMNVYQQSFPPGQTAISRGAFAGTLWRIGAGTVDCRYHLWGVRHSSAGPIQGMASFFTLKHAGFAGYLTLTGELARTGRCRLLLARIEEQIVRDRPGAVDWFLECEPETPQFAVFSHLGFSPVPIDYHQPSLSRIDASSPPSQPDSPLVLMRKSIGLSMAAPPRQPDVLPVQLSEILQHVYGMSPQRAQQTAQQMFPEVQ